jgi:hypothetical protein
LGAIGVGKGWMISYRHMCRWNSGFFYKHPRLKDFDWYWRVEPDVWILALNAELMLIGFVTGSLLLRYRLRCLPLYAR